jgi:hypothetical protein
MTTCKTFEEEQKIRHKQKDTGSRVAVRIDTDEVMYRGYVIKRNDSVPTGYWGRYECRLSTKNRESTSSLKGIKKIVDDHIDKKNTAEVK